MKIPFRIVNVFGIEGSLFSGNPLCVFPDGGALSDREMLAFARQVNLSETTFVLSAADAACDARVRIFTPAYEMPFAGHPILGTAHTIARGRGALALETKAGTVRVTLAGTRVELRAAVLPKVRKPSATRGELAAMVGLDERAIDGEPAWIDTGVEQLVVPIASAELVRRAIPVADALLRHAKNGLGEALVYLIARDGDRFEVRAFFTQHGAVVEDPATGSACANLGGYLSEVRGERGGSYVLAQGHAVDRPSELFLRVDEEGRSFVAGRVLDVGEGTFVAPS